MTTATDSLADTVFAKADPLAIRTDPFPHLVIENALPVAVLEQLLRSPPALEQGASRPATRLALSGQLLTRLDFIDPAWADFAARHMTPAITHGVARLFQDHWPAHLKALDLANARFDPLSLSDPGPDTDILYDARLVVITPNPDQPAAHRAAHLDGSNRIFSALFYLRDPADDSNGGGLTLYRFTGDRPTRAEDMDTLPPDAVEAVVTIPNVANTLVVFPNRPDAIHGAEIRSPSSLPRRYIFMTAETPDPLY